MAHEISITADGRAEMAWATTPPWHGLGQRVDPDAGIDEWRIAAGLDWDIKSAPVQFMNGELRQFPERQVLYRSDTSEPLSVVSNYYNVVQPEEVIGFFRDLVESGGFRLNTAGALRGGRRIWALAEIGKAAKIIGDDAVGGYLLLATSCDGGLSTTAQFTSVRVVCANTLAMADRVHAARKIAINHSTKFCPDEIKAGLGIAASSFDDFVARARDLANKSVSADTAERVIARLLDQPEPGQKNVRYCTAYKQILELFAGKGIGAEMDGVRGTAWGLVNAVTEYYDHRKRATSNDTRINDAWFGNAAQIKSRAFDMLLAA